MERLMEKLQGPINPTLFEEHLSSLVSAEEGQQGQLLSTNFSLEENMSFLKMLQSLELASFTQSLSKIRHFEKQPWEMERQIEALEPESCITHDMLEEMHPRQLHSASCLEDLSPECNQEEPLSVRNSSSIGHIREGLKQKSTRLATKSTQQNISRERRKRKRSNTRPAKNKEDVESQRMTHIAVERNRRRQMNEHLTALRALMPPSYVQRGDQASIVGGAINFVKELEQLLQSLEAQKRMRMNKLGDQENVEISFNSLVHLNTNVSFKLENDCSAAEGSCSCFVDDESAMRENDSEVASNIQVTVIQNHVNLKIQCARKPSQLLKVIVALEDFSLTVLHLSITSLQNSVILSFNLKTEEDCKLGTADEIAAAVHQMLNFING